MSRLESVVSWFLTTLGLLLVGGSIFVVPANALGDAGSDCYDKCFGECGPETTCFNECVASCCAGTCNEETEECDETCCETGCQSDPTCTEECQANLKKFFKCLLYTFPTDPDNCKNKGIECVRIYWVTFVCGRGLFGVCVCNTQKL